MFVTFKCGIFSKIKIKGLQNDQNCSFISPKIARLDSMQISNFAKSKLQISMLRTVLLKQKKKIHLPDLNFFGEPFRMSIKSNKHRSNFLKEECCSFVRQILALRINCQSKYSGGQSNGEYSGIFTYCTITLTFISVTWNFYKPKKKNSISWNLVSLLFYVVNSR